ncbi:hypothetical protein COO60DRAFT_1649728 [Scenedesmus sp. NREL 46B-D3]|nr:hypothetical protein COO60DRAFT_1649728 [Scenedesmus sp. NREL 46B-D3]
MAEEKMHIAAQVYDMVDLHIRNLDEDLTKFALDLDEEQRESGLAPGETACFRLGMDLGLPPAAQQQQQQQAAAAAAAAPQQGEQRQKRKYTRRKGMEGAAADTAGTSAAAAAAAADGAVPLAAAVAELEGDASEPRYCVCKGVSYGDMVCCDNEECPVEWFHFPCVGLTEQPKGKCLGRKATCLAALAAGLCSSSCTAGLAYKGTIGACMDPGTAMHAMQQQQQRTAMCSREKAGAGSTGAGQHRQTRRAAGVA